MSEVTLSKAVRANLLNLQKTAAQLGITQERLATGLKVNSALDNPTNFFTASSLNSRAADMNALLDAMSNGIQTIEAADNGITAITKNLESMVSTLTQARQDKTFKSSSYDLDNTAIGTSTLKNLTFSGGAVTGSVDIALNTPGTAVPSTVTGAGAYVAPTAATGPVSTSASAFVGLDVADGDETYDFTVNGIAVSLTAADDTTADNTISLGEAVTAINAQLTLDGTTTIQARNSLTVPGNIEFFDTTATGVAASIDLSTVTTGGTSPAGNLWAGDPAAVTGADAVDRVITITTAAGTTGNITLTSANAATAANAKTVIDAAIAGSPLAGTVTSSLNGTTLSLAGAADGSNSLTVGGAGVNSVFGGAPTTVAGTPGTVGTVKTIDQLVNAINANTSLNTAIRASIDNNKLRIENLSTSELTVTGYDSTSSKVDGGTGTATIGGNTVRADLATQYNTLIDQLDKFSDDASFNGVNLLRGDTLKITFNETSTSEIDIQTKDGNAINSANLGVKTAMLAADLDSDTAIEAFIVQVKSALHTVRSQASAFGSNLSVVQNRQDFTKHMITTLQTGAANLTLADSNEEAANLLALQTRQQLSSTALSLASEADQNVLRLF